MQSNTMGTELDSVARCDDATPSSDARAPAELPTAELAPTTAQFPAEATKKTARPARAGAYCSQLEWLILCGDAAMGASGTLAGVVSQIERGSVGGSGRLDRAGSYVHPYTDLQMGVGSSAIGEVELHRHLSAAWSLLPPALRRRLTLRYSAPRAEFRADHGFGAKDRFVEGSDGRTGQHAPTRTGIDPDSEFGQYAALAFDLADNPAQLLIALVEPDPVRKGKTNKSEQVRRRALVKECLRRAQAVDAEDHAAWYAAKAQVPALRSFKDRVGRERTVTPIDTPRRPRAPRSGRLLTMSDSELSRLVEGAQSGALAAE